MIKAVSFSFIFIYSAIVPMIAGAEPYDHPMDSVLKNLAQTSKEIDQVAIQNADLKAESESLKARVIELTVEAMLAPVKTTDNKLYRFGFEIVKSVYSPFSLDYRETENIQQMNIEAFNMKPESWQNLFTLVTQARRETEEIRALVIGKYADMLPKPQRDKVLDVLAYNRTEALRKVLDRVRRTVKCLDYFSQAFQTYGLRPIEMDSVIAWSQPDLKRVYGVDHFDEISGLQKSRAIQGLEEMLSGAALYGYYCVSKASARFMDAQKKALEK